MPDAATDTKSQHKKSFLKKRWKEILAVVFLLFAGYFFWQQRNELKSLGSSLENTSRLWLWIGIAYTVAYILLQAALYVYSFIAVRGSISATDAIELFSKRNVIAVFLPGGGLTALAYLPSGIKGRQPNDQQIHHASVIYGFIGIFSVFLVAVPVLLYLSIKNTDVPGATAGFITMIAMLVAMVWFIRSVQVKGKFYRWLIKGKPKVKKFLDEVFSFDLIWKHFWYATIVSVFIEVVGVLHVYLAMIATGVEPSLGASITGYIVAAVLLIISPFLRGMGAIEVSLTFILKSYGYTTVQALQIALLFRLFEFWLPLLVGFAYYVYSSVRLVVSKRRT